MTRGLYGIRTGIWIRDYIMRNGPSSPYQIYKEMKSAFPDKHIGDAHTIMTVMWLLYSKLHLIKKVGTVQSKNHKFYQLYDVVPRMVNSNKWENIYKSSYPSLYTKAKISKRLKKRKSK